MNIKYVINILNRTIEAAVERTIERRGQLTRINVTVATDDAVYTKSTSARQRCDNMRTMRRRVRGGATQTGCHDKGCFPYD